jgi:enamine deaminase RidA (YjgF/YER057c/UK114 family)
LRLHKEARMEDRASRFEEVAAALGHGFEGEIRIGGNYSPVIRHENVAYVSGQVPRVGNVVVVTGRVGAEVAIEPARRAAKICAMRALALLARELGSLDRVRQLLRITVYVQCDAAFTQQSEVADAASDLLRYVLGPAGTHTRTSVGVLQLPKNASVELDLIAAVDTIDTGTAA